MDASTTTRPGSTLAKPAEPSSVVVSRPAIGRPSTKANGTAPTFTSRRTPGADGPAQSKVLTESTPAPGSSASCDVSPNASRASSGRSDTGTVDRAATSSPVSGAGKT